MSPGGCRVAGRVFISYRRADTANQAAWLADRLAGHFGRQQVVRDVEEIQLDVRGYMGLYVESISDSPSTAAAEFDNFTAAQL